MTGKKRDIYHNIFNVSEKIREDIPYLRDGFQFHYLVLKQRLLVVVPRKSLKNELHD